MGVTHLLMLEPVDASQPGLEPIWIGFDALLSRALGRYDEPFYLYRIENAPGRVSLQSDGPTGHAEIVGYEPSQVVIEASSEEGGTLVLRDLMAPGWHVSVDGEPAEAVLVDEVFRGVELPAGTHRVEWRYEPASFRVRAAADGAVGAAADRRPYRPQATGRLGAAARQLTRSRFHRVAAFPWQRHGNRLSGFSSSIRGRTGRRRLRRRPGRSREPRAAVR